MKLHHNKTITALLLTLQLAACGGGGGGGSDSPAANNHTDDPQIASTSYSGVAAKGTLANAQVAIYKVDTAIASQPLATGTTNEQGEFTLSLSTTPALIYVEVTKKNANSWMVCDLLDCGASTNPAWDSNNNQRSDYGEKVALSADFTLGAYLFDYQEGDSISVNLFTHIVAKSFTAPPSKEQLNNRYLAIKNYLNLSAMPYDVAPFNPALLSKGGSDLSDTLMMLSLLPQATGRFENMADIIEQLATAMKTHGSLAAIPTISITLAAINAHALLLVADPGNTALISQLQQLSVDAAASENLVAPEDRPKLPPLT